MSEPAVIQPGTSETSERANHNNTINSAINFSYISNDDDFEESYNSVKYILKMLVNNELITDGDNEEILNELNNRVLFASVNIIYFMPWDAVAHLLKVMRRTRKLVIEQRNKNPIGK